MEFEKPMNRACRQKALEILQSVFGYSSFRDQQEEIIAEIASGHDALVLMPTGEVSLSVTRFLHWFGMVSGSSFPL